MPQDVETKGAVYKDLIISTIVDVVLLGLTLLVYKDLIISTIVDIRALCPLLISL